MALRVAELRIEIYDVARAEWRSFLVMPFDPGYRPKCGAGLHQFHTLAPRCPCGEIQRGSDDCA